jgi:hypothetical protein
MRDTLIQKQLPNNKMVDRLVLCFIWKFPCPTICSSIVQLAPGRNRRAPVSNGARVHRLRRDLPRRPSSAARTPVEPCRGFLKIAKPSINFDPTPGPSPYLGGEKEAKNGVRLVLRTTAHHFSHYHPILDRRKAEIRLKILTLRKPWEPCRG